jgi:hypothetical protein
MTGPCFKSVVSGSGHSLKQHIEIKNEICMLKFDKMCLKFSNLLLNQWIVLVVPRPIVAESLYSV